MNQHPSRKTIVRALAVAFTLFLAGAAQAGDFDFGHPDVGRVQLDRLKASIAPPARQAAQEVRTTAETLKHKPRVGVSTEESRALMGEDAGLLWMSQQGAQPAAATPVARLEAAPR